MSNLDRSCYSKDGKNPHLDHVSNAYLITAFNEFHRLKWFLLLPLLGQVQRGPEYIHHQQKMEDTFS